MRLAYNVLERRSQLSKCFSGHKGVRTGLNEKCDTRRIDRNIFWIILPVPPKTKWYDEIGLKHTQQTFTLAFIVATDLSDDKDHNLT